jgi:ribosomal protein S18 acetylase RimI-like enzyme
MAEVRQARLDDAKRLAEVHVASWQKAYDGLLPSEFLMALSVTSRFEWWSRRLIAFEGHGDALVVAAVPAGFVDGFALLGPSSGTEGEVYAIYVDPLSWRSGLGSELLTASEHSLGASGFEEAILWVLEGNHRGRSFYEKLGWRADGALKIEEIGGIQVTELRYRKDLGSQ